MSDLISRQAAIELCDWYEHEYSEVESYFQKFNEELKELPSAESAELKAIREQALFCAAELLKLVAMIKKGEKDE